MTRPQREIDLDYRVALALGDIGEIAAWERRWFSQQAAAAPAEFAPTPADDAVLERAFAEVAAVVAARQRAFADAAAALRAAVPRVNRTRPRRTTRRVPARRPARRE